jgi:hypothetical protein
MRMGRRRKGTPASERLGRMRGLLTGSLHDTLTGMPPGTVERPAAIIDEDWATRILSHD